MRGDAPAARSAVLAIDDDPLVLDLVRLYLWDYDVTTASSGRAALSLLAVACPPLILLDVRMPAMDGLETLVSIRRGLGLTKARVMMLTAAADRPTIAKAIERGADGYLLKPFSRGSLVGRIDRLPGCSDAPSPGQPRRI